MCYHSDALIVRRSNMSDLFTTPALFLGIVPLIILIAFLINYPRARRWAQKDRAQGNVTCSTSGPVGALLGRTHSDNDRRPSDHPMGCAECNRTDWHIPDAE